MAVTPNTKVAGVDVLVSVGTEVIGGQSGAKLTKKMDVIETTDKTSGGWVTKVGGIKEFSVECDSFFILSDKGQAALSKAFNDRTTVEVSMATGTTAGHIKWTGTVLVSELGYEFAQDDAVTFSIKFEGTGALTETVLPAS
ncbi:phage tail tube protein [Bacillus paramobilis]|uniref:phage tail tube protein n=1 Tax=Bacillus paramobilis TaxID=2817477 RepID=UPI001BB446FB|nr:phage tail tube protein [Bacillus paramobilis]HEF5065823.1 phage major tail protein, TP901-1 family [Bacillus cereus]HEF5237807.1 phage major tail protein, TP901-1 family [Bacillus cereus]